MENFISVDNVNNMDALIKKALMYKANPFADKMLGTENELDYYF